jgi:thiamine biosynthesis lipoprotein
VLRRAKPLLGTLVEIGFEVGTLDPVQANTLMASAFSRIQEISHTLSFHSNTSELSQLNQAWGHWRPMGQDGIRVLTLAKHLGRLSQERFNCTVGGELVNRDALPCNVQHAFLARGCWQDIQLTSNSAKLARPVLLTLDGIAKGYAVDMAVSVLKRAGIKGGWVNAGGDLKVFGTTSLAVYLRGHDGLSQPIKLMNTALASSRICQDVSADFPALFINTGTNPALESEPPQTETIVSVRAPFAWRADALTKLAGSNSVQACNTIIADFGGELLQFDYFGR